MTVCLKQGPSPNEETHPATRTIGSYRPKVVSVETVLPERRVGGIGVSARKVLQAIVVRHEEIPLELIVRGAEVFGIPRIGEADRVVDKPGAAPRRPRGNGDRVDQIGDREMVRVVGAAGAVPPFKALAVPVEIGGVHLGRGVVWSERGKGRR